jgi:hypothetical protein
MLGVHKVSPTFHAENRSPSLKRVQIPRMERTSQSNPTQSERASQLIDNAEIVQIEPESIPDHKAQFLRTKVTLIVPDQLVSWY